MASSSPFRWTAWMVPAARRSTSAGIVEALGGRIAVGDAEGGGAAITATLP